MPAIVFVTGNAGKLVEMRDLLRPFGLEVVQDPGGYPEIQADTLEEVTSAGADHLAKRIRGAFVLEDSGLFVDALNGFPGVYSRNALDTLGCAGILRLLAGKEEAERSAAFKTHLLYVDDGGRRHGFAGECRGMIADSVSGRGGFGFDPIFVPAGHDRTFAQMDVAEKNRLSHRGQAVRAFLGMLSKTAVR